MGTEGRSFVVLKPTGRSKELHALEEKAVRQLERLRAPLTEAERRRREAAGLTPLQRYYLDAWGYPYVLNEFRPHLTLSNALADPKALTQALRWDFEMRVPAPRTWRIDTVTLFGERESDGLFEIVQEFPLGHGRRADGSPRGSWRWPSSTEAKPRRRRLRESILSLFKGMEWISRATRRTVRRWPPERRNAGPGGPPRLRPANSARSGSLPRRLECVQHAFGAEKRGAIQPCFEPFQRLATKFREKIPS